MTCLSSWTAFRCTCRTPRSMRSDSLHISTGTIPKTGGDSGLPWRPAAQRVTRDELAETFSAQLTARADQAATYAAGYIARTREWGPKRSSKKADTFSPHSVRNNPAS